MKFAEVEFRRVSGNNVGRLPEFGALFDRFSDPKAKPEQGTGQGGKVIMTEKLLAIWTL